MAPICSRHVPHGVAFLRASKDSPLMRRWIAKREAQAAAIRRDITAASP
jgi:hypothetical protein